MGHLEALVVSVAALVAQLASVLRAALTPPVALPRAAALALPVTAADLPCVVNTNIALLHGL